MRSRRTDLGIVTTSRWMSHRRTTWATVLPCALPISVGSGSVKRLFFPSANPPHDAAAAHSPADPFLVLVGGGRVDVAVAHLEGGADGQLGLVRGDLEDTEPEDGHIDAVVERDTGDRRVLHDLRKPTPASG
jgi:hypothetical protein